LRILSTVFIASMAFGLLIFPAPSHAASGEGEPKSVDITGKVINKTVEGQGVAGLEVRIYQYDRKNVTEIAKVKTGTDGSFLFSGLKPEPSLVYYVMTEYKNIFYFSDAFHINGNLASSVELPIYETTDRYEDISVKVHHILFEPSDGSLWVREFIVFENRDNRTFVGQRKVEGSDRREVVRVSLPQGALDLQFERSMTGRIIKTEDGFISTAELRPGPTNLQFSYRVSTPDSSYFFKRTVNMKTESIEMIFPAAGIRVTTDEARFKGPTMESDQRFLHLSGKDFEKGAELAVRLDFGRRDGFLKWILGGIGAFVFVVGFAFSVLRGRRTPVAEPSPAGEGLDKEENREALLRRIADLDLRHEQGEIDPDVYRAERTALVEEIKKLSL